MNARELVARFPSVPRVLHGEPVLERFAVTFDELLQIAAKPSPCSAKQQTASNHAYMKLVGPLELVAFGLATKERAIADMQKLIERAEKDKKSLWAELVPASAPKQGGGCAGEGQGDGHEHEHEHGHHHHHR